MIGSAPILLARDLAETISFWRDRVGFTKVTTFGEPPGFAILRRDGCTLMYAQAGMDAAITPHWQVVEKTANVYFWVDDVVGFYDEVVRAGGLKPDWDLCEQPYGVREFGLQDPNGYDVAFGQVIDA